MALTDYVSEIETSSNEMFFAISNDLAKIKAIQEQTIENQNKNWKVTRRSLKQYKVISIYYGIAHKLCSQVNSWTLIMIQHHHYLPLSMQT